MGTADGALWCIVPAAGRGSRFGGETPKQYLNLCGKPLLLHTLDTLAAHPRIAGIVVALAADDRYWPRIAVPARKPVLTVIGGERRAESVLSGLRRLHGVVAASDFVLVHDAARPCVRDADIGSLIALGVPAGGALLAVPLRDTLKRADDSGHVAATEPRAMRWRAQTPQLFAIGELIVALESALAAGIEITDEAMAMERIGRRPLLVAGADSNIKITTPEDLRLAEVLLASERAQVPASAGGGP